MGDVDHSGTVIGTEQALACWDVSGHPGFLDHPGFLIVLRDSHIDVDRHQVVCPWDEKRLNLAAGFLAVALQMDSDPCPNQSSYHGDVQEGGRRTVAVRSRPLVDSSLKK